MAVGTGRSGACTALRDSCPNTRLLWMHSSAMGKRQDLHSVDLQGYDGSEVAPGFDEAPEADAPGVAQEPSEPAGEPGSE